MSASEGLRTYQFTFQDAAWMARAGEKSLRLWMQRGHLSIGHKHFLGRWEFSLLDVIQLTTLQHLSACNLMNLEQAAVVAREVAVLAEQPAGEAGGRMLIVVFRDGFPACFLNTKTNVEVWAEPLRRPAVMVPVDSIVADTRDRVEDLRRHNEQKEGGDDAES